MANNRAPGPNDVAGLDGSRTRTVQGEKLHLLAGSSDVVIAPGNNQNPQNQRNHEKGIPLWQAILIFMKIYVGVGILEIPHAVSHAGLLLGIVLILLVGGLTYYATRLLVKNSQKLIDRIQVNGSPTKLLYHETVEEALMLSCCTAGCAKFFGHAVDVMIIATEIAVVGNYMLFIAESMQTICQSSTSREHPLLIFLLIGLSLIVVINWILSIGRLTILSVVGFVIQVVGCLIIIIFCFVDKGNNFDIDPYVTRHPWKIPVSFGITMHAFENISVILPLRSIMKEPRKFENRYGVLDSTIGLVTFLSVGIGFYGYWNYGNNIQDSISFNLPQNNLWSDLCRGFLATAILCSAPFQMYVPFKIMWKLLVKKFQLKRYSKCKRNFLKRLFRTFVCCVAFGLPFFVPHLSTYAGVVGSLSSTIICLWVPIFVDICVLCKENEEAHAAGTGGVPGYGRQLCVNIVLLCCASMMVVFGTGATVYEICGETHK